MLRYSRLAVLAALLPLAACDSGGPDEITSVVITEIVVEEMPFTDANGDEWDSGLAGDADVYVRAQLNGITVRDTRRSDFEDLDANDLPAELDLDGGITLNQLVGDLTFELADRDGGAASEDPLIGETDPVNLAALVAAEQTTRTFTSAGALGRRVVLSVTFEYE